MSFTGYILMARHAYISPRPAVKTSQPLSCSMPCKVTLSSPPMSSTPLLIGLIREGKTPPDKRVPLTPEQCKAFNESHDQARIIVQSSPIRCFTDEEYLQAGVEVVEDISVAEVLLGVKEVPSAQLIPNKTYFFFSHTFKKQEYNRALLRAVLDKHIRLIDYELLTQSSGRRIIGFGRYAGVVGAYNGLIGWGKITGDFRLKAAHNCFDRHEVNTELQKVKLPNDFKLVMTGGGRVAGGISEILQSIGLHKVDPNDFLIESFDRPVYSALTVQEYVRRVDGRSFYNHEFYKSADGFESAFLPYAQEADMFIAGHYWEEGSPFFFTRQDARNQRFNLRMIADISCDIDGPVASTIRPSTITNPFYGYDPQSESEVGLGELGSIGVMAVDNLPGELPRDASEDFGAELLNDVLPQLFNHDRDGILRRATEAENGHLTPHFSYLQDYVNA